jgi:mannose-6-phosphate isomerase
MHQVRRIEKPWGYELIWATTKDYVAKILYVRAGESLSLQYHKIKEETIFLEEGNLLLEIGDTENALKQLEMKPGDSFHIEPGRIHRFNAKTECKIFEVSTPFLSDVVRLKDKYGRE